MNSAHLEMIPPISRKHTFCQPAATPELEAELFPSGSFFPHGNQILDMYCARARPPGSQDSGTMHCPSLGETAMSHIYMHVLAMLPAWPRGVPVLGGMRSKNPHKHALSFQDSLHQDTGSFGLQPFQTQWYNISEIFLFGIVPVRIYIGYDVQQALRTVRRCSNCS